MKKIPLLIASLALCTTALAQQYKWVDQNGKLQYGDTPPAGVKATPLKPPPAPPAAAPAPGKKGEKALTPEQAFQKRQKDQQEAAAKAEKEKAENDVKRANCESARANLRQLQSGERMSTTNASGERVYLDDAARAAETGRAKKAVADWCG